MGIVIDLFHSIFLYTSLKQVNEEDICMNIKELKRYKWFNSYLERNDYRNLIVHDWEVRQLIGKFKTGKLADREFVDKIRKILYKLLERKVEQIA